MTSAVPVKKELSGWIEAAQKGIERTDSQAELLDLIAKAQQRFQQLQSGAVNLGSGCANGSKRRKTSNDEKVRESSSDEKCKEGSSDEKQADIENSIEGGNFSMIMFSALEDYTINGVDLGFEVYRFNRQDTGAEQLEGTRHTVYYIPFDGVESGMEILFYVFNTDRAYPQYITEKDMERSENEEAAEATVHYCQDFSSLATNARSHHSRGHGAFYLWHRNSGIDDESTQTAWPTGWYRQVLVL